MNLLPPLRVLDITRENGFLCGKMLADLGCDVLKIEEPGGDPGRLQGPFYQDTPNPDKSLYWWAFNANKRGITLNIEEPEGREIFLRLAEKADFVIESFTPGYLDDLGLGYRDLSKLNSGLVMTSITPFGQSGPYARYKSTDLIGMAMGGIMYISGDADRPPVRVSYPQAWSHAALQAAMGTMNAYYYRESTGKGQHVDASMQLSVIWTQMNVTITWDISRMNTLRGGAVKTYSMVRDGKAMDVPVRYTWKCKDGHVNFVIIGAGPGVRVNQALVEWMNSEGMGLELKDFDWTSQGFVPTDPETREMLERNIGEFFESHTVEELYEGAVAKRIWIAPIGTPAYQMVNPQLGARSFWQEVFDPDIGETVVYPGWPIRQSESPVGPPRRAPHVGEHNEEIYIGEMGLETGVLVRLQESGVI